MFQCFIYYLAPIQYSALTHAVVRETIGVAAPTIPAETQATTTQTRTLCLLLPMLNVHLPTYQGWELLLSEPKRIHLLR